MWRLLGIALIPFFALLVMTSSACLMSYGIALALDEPSLLRKTMIRLSQAMLLLSIFPVSRWLKLKGADLGYAPFSLMLKQFTRGFLLSLLTLLPIFGVLQSLGVHVIDPTKDWALIGLLKKIGEAFGLALLIAIVEESVFRGLLLSSLKNYLSVVAAVFVSAFYYAALHFLTTKSSIPASEFNLASAFLLLGEAYANVLSMKEPTAFLALLAVGLFLGHLRTRNPKSLALCMGCHAGWVWQIKMSKTLCYVDFNSPYAFLVSHYDGVIGLLVMGWLLLGLVFLRMPFKATQQ
jgi:membrane protease YdiL (CAAX protease family)